MKKILGCLLGLLWAIPSHAELPASYTQLEYIKTDGNSYIDTPIMITGNEHWTMDIGSLDTGTMPSASVGSLSSGTVYATKNNFSVTYIQPSQLTIYLDGNTGVTSNAWRSSTSLMLDKKMHHLEWFNLTTAPQVDGVNMTQDDTGVPPVAITPIVPVRLFGRADTGAGIRAYAGIAIGRFSGDTWDYIPVKRNSDGVLGMYDMVSGEFLTNDGTGDFIAGPVAEIKIATTKYVDDEFAPLNTALANAISVVDNVVTQTIAQAGQIATLQNTKQTRPDDDDECPAGKKCLLVTDETGTPHWYEIIEGRLPDGYTELEYVESTGTQYIDTGINFDTTTIGFKVILDNTAAQPHIGSSTANYIAGRLGNGYAGAFIRVSSGTNNAIHYSNSAADVTPEKQVSSVVSNRDVIEYNYKNSRKKIFNGVDTNYDVGSHNYSGSLILFGVQDSTAYSSAIKMYVCEVTDGSTVVRNLIPAKRNSDSAIGMYDIVSGTFFENAGSGSFIGGAPVF